MREGKEKSLPFHFNSISFEIHVLTIPSPSHHVTRSHLPNFSFFSIFTHAGNRSRWSNNRIYNNNSDNHLKFYSLNLDKYLRNGSGVEGRYIEREETRVERVARSS